MARIESRKVALCIGFAALAACGRSEPRNVPASVDGNTAQPSSQSSAMTVANAPLPSAEANADAGALPSSKETADTKPASGPFVSKCEAIVLEVALEKEQHDGLVQLETKIRNKGKTDVPLMLTGDGSSFGKRNPEITFTLTPNDIGDVGTCGFINAMEDSDFFTLKAGEARKLDWIHPPTPGKPGRYVLRANYRNDPAVEPLRGGAPKPATPAQRAKLAATLPCEAVSNDLTIQWDGKRARP